MSFLRLATAFIMSSQPSTICSLVKPASNMARTASSILPLLCAFHAAPYALLFSVLDSLPSVAYPFLICLTMRSALAPGGATSCTFLDLASLAAFFIGSALLPSLSKSKKSGFLSSYMPPNPLLAFCITLLVLVATSWSCRR